MGWYALKAFSCCFTDLGICIIDKDGKDNNKVLWPHRKRSLCSHKPCFFWCLRRDKFFKIGRYLHSCLAPLTSFFTSLSSLLSLLIRPYIVFLKNMPRNLLIGLERFINGITGFFLAPNFTNSSWIMSFSGSNLSPFFKTLMAPFLLSALIYTLERFM